MRKKIKLSLITIALVLLHSTFCVGQLNTADAQQNFDNMASGSSMFKTFDNRFKGVEGTVTLFEKYQRGRLFLSMGRPVVRNEINYDAVTNEVMIIQNGQETILSAMSVVGFEIFSSVGDTLKFERIVLPSDKIIYAQRLNHKGGVGLFKQSSKKVVEASYKGAYSPGKTYKELLLVEKFFIKTDAFHEITNKKDFIRAFPDQADQLNTFIKENKLSFKEQADVERLVAFLNSIKKN